MSDAGVEQRLADLLQCTERMLACAGAEDWDGLELLAQERQQRMERCFGPSLDADSSERVTEAIALLLSLNSRLVEQVSYARSAVMDDIAGLRHRRGSTGAYGMVRGLKG